MDWRLLILFILAAYVAGKAVLTWLAYATLVFGGAFALACVAGAARVLRRRPAASEPALPPVTVLKPLKGTEPGLYENLASFCRQDYPQLQIIFALASPLDPALPVVDRLRRDFPDRDISVVVADGCIGCNPKINNVANAYPLAKHGLLLLSDSDVRVPQDFLRRSVRPFARPDVGLVTCFYRCRETRGLGGALEALSVNAHFLPQALLAGAAGMRFAMGAAILVRRSAFDRIGAFPALADHLADDFALGAAIAEAGYRVEFSDVVIETVAPDGERLSEVFRHQVRWQRTVYLCNPAGYCGSFVLHGFSLATLALILFGWNARLAALAGAFLALKSVASLAVQRLGEARPRLASLAYLPLSEWLTFGAWLAGFAPGAVLWRGQRYRVLPGGRLVPVEADAAPERMPETPIPLAAKP